MTRLTTFLQTHPKEVLVVLLVLFLILLALSIWAWNPPNNKITTFAALRGEVLDLHSPSVYPLDTLVTPDYPTPSANTIPYIVHRVVIDDDKGQNTTKLTHLETWEQKTFTAQQQHDFVTSTFGRSWPDIVHAYNLCRFTEIQICMFKYLVVYHYGGLYMDANAVSLKPFDELVSSDKALVCPCAPPTNVDLIGDMTQGQGEYETWWVMAPPKSEFLWQVVWQVVRNIFLLHTQGKNLCKFTQLSSNITDSTADGVCYTYVACKFKDLVNVCKNDFLALRHNRTVQRTTRFAGLPSPHLGDMPVHLVYVQNHKSQTVLLTKHKIPAIIHQTHETRWVTPAMAQAMKTLRGHAPYCEYRFYDDNERRRFIEKHYPSALGAYNALIPGCYRADLFRAIVVYTLGGVYFDSGFSPSEGTDLFKNVISEDDEFVFPIDEWIQGLLTGFFAATQNHPYLKAIIDHIVTNIEDRKMFKTQTGGFLQITGPKAYADALCGLLPRPLTEGVHHPNMRLLYFPVGKSVYKLGKLVYTTQYKGYYEDQKLINHGVPHYKYLWEQNQIYNTSVMSDLTALLSLPPTMWPDDLPILYINLDRDTLRNEYVIKELKGVSSNVTRISAIDGRSSDKQNVKVVSDFGSLTPCEVACTASHLKAIKFAFDLNVEKAIICEDDASFAPMRIWAQHQIDTFHKSVTNDVGLVLLTWGGCEFGQSLSVRLVQTTSGLYGTVAYIITRRGMVDILGHSQVSSTHIHLKKTKLVSKGQADGYLYSLTTVATSSIPLALPNNIVHKSSINDRKHFDHDNLHNELLGDIVNHVKRISKSNPRKQPTIGQQPSVYGSYNVNEHDTMLTRQIFCVWAGDDEMSDNRKRCLEQFKTVCGCNVIVVNPSNLHTFILPQHPVHPSFEFLSLTHKADYLRTYLMHFHGGGYSDVKETTGSWVHAFEQLEKNSDLWVCGYPEVSHGVAFGPLVHKWKELVGNCAYICKPQTPFTTEWYNAMVAVLDSRLERLKLYPATHPQEQGDSAANHKGYPIEWNEMLGRIFHKLNYKYIDHVSNVLPISNFSNYR
jgi:mannosyltransferase OCH1-like enzyme